MLNDVERLLDQPEERQVPAAPPPRRHRLAPLFVLVGLGVAVALTAGGKEALITGRSVAQAVHR